MIIPAVPIQCIIAFVTAPNIETARKIAQAALGKGLAACANIVPQIESHYWWEEKLETSSEALIIFKTTSNARANFANVSSQIIPTSCRNLSRSISITEVSLICDGFSKTFSRAPHAKNWQPLPPALDCPECNAVFYC
jgi:uncharacterized protein involved in tolerance to divalent cations